MLNFWRLNKLSMFETWNNLRKLMKVSGTTLEFKAWKQNFFPSKEYFHNLFSLEKNCTVTKQVGPSTCRCSRWRNRNEARTKKTHLRGDTPFAADSVLKKLLMSFGCRAILRFQTANGPATSRSSFSAGANWVSSSLLSVQPTQIRLKLG